MNTFQLKLAAVILMVVDHIGFFIFPEYRILRIVGRLSFPLFAFLITNGYMYTSNKQKYLLRLFIFANIIQLPSFFVMIPVNIFYTLSFGLCLVMIYESTYSKWYKGFTMIGVVLITELVNPDYGIYGVLLILLIHLLKNKWLYLMIGMAIMSGYFFGIFDIQMYSVLSIPLMMSYNNERGPKMKYMFYIFYPTHIVFLDWLSQQIR